MKFASANTRFVVLPQHKWKSLVRHMGLAEAQMIGVGAYVKV